MWRFGAKKVAILGQKVMDLGSKSGFWGEKVEIWGAKCGFWGEKVQFWGKRWILGQKVKILG